MNMPSESLVNAMKKDYPVGTNVKLVSMVDDVNPVPSGTIGEVVFVDDMGQVHVDWENGSGLALIPMVDHFVKV